MKPVKSSVGADEEVSALVETLLETEQQLEKLTAGEVDTVVDRYGRTFLLRRSQEQLRHSEAAKQAAILNALPAHIALLDTKGTIISANDAWRRFASANAIHGPGYGIGVNYLKICDDAQGDGSSEAHLVAEGIRSVLGGEEKSFSIEYPCHSPTEQRWFLLTVTPLDDDSPNGAVVMHLNITERKRAGEALRASEEQFRQLADNIHQVFFIQTPEPVRMAYISPAYDEIWGRSRYELYNRPEAWIESVHTQDREHVAHIFVQCMQGLPTEIEFRVVRPDGSVRWIHARSFPVFDSTGKFIRAVGIADDITERHRALEEIRNARADAEAASRVKSEFLANMSHELRTPLNGIMGMTDLALDTELNSEQREYLDTVKLSADSLLIVVNDILDLSKIEAGKFDLEVTDFNLRDSLETTLRTLSVRADEKGLELLCEVAAKVPEVIRGDSNRLRQIVVNLVGNAVKFTDKGEVVLKVQVEAEDGDDRILHFVVADTGIGIPAEKQQIIFDAFSQADSSTTRKFGGTGLGLTISKRLVEKMGGKLWVESEVGRGSEFHFTALLGTSEKTIDVNTIAPPEILRNVKILVVDDNRTNRRLLEGMLKRWKMNSTLVEDGEKALVQLSAAHE
jgi:two-component system, sensor histidine kinase and response regulator